MNRVKVTAGLVLALGLLFYFKTYAGDIKPDNPYSQQFTIARGDTIKPRYDSFINDTIKNPFDLKDPSIIEKKVEYDPETGLYIITEKIGNDYFTAPTYMTFEEYLKWKERQQRREYFNRLSGRTGKGNLSKRGIVDPAASVNVKKDLVERIFGGNEITIKPQGSIHLTLGLSRQIMNNPAFEFRAQRLWNPIFDEGIQVNVEGGIGDKMKLNFNYNTKASFDFDNKIKLKYDSEQFNEDAIVKKIEAGNVSLPLRGNLIQGGQNLFGIKTELQFGHLRLTAIASQQRSEQKNIKIDKGAVKQEFSITPDQYDENRHFFVSHYNRETYEKVLKDLPNLKTPFRITRIEVWVIPERNETHDLRDICALADLGEGDLKYYANPNPVKLPNPTPDFIDPNDPEHILPDNRVSAFFEDVLRKDDETRLKTNVSFNLESRYNMKSGRDFEVFKGRKLNPSEYTYNAELGFISLNRPLQPEDVLGVSFEYTYSYGELSGKVYSVGEFNELTDTVGKVMYVKMLKSKAQKPGLPEWDLMMKNIYYIGTSDIDRESFKLDIYFEDDSDGSLKRFIPDPHYKDYPLLEVFNLDKINIVGDIQPDGIFDFIPGITVIPRLGSVIFPVLEPFGRSLDSLFKDSPGLADKYKFEELYTESIVNAQKHPEKNKFLLKGEYKSKESSEISLGTWNLQGNPIVTSGGKVLIEGVDYDLDRGAGKIRIINPAILQSGRPVNVRFEDNSLFNLTQKNLIGLRADYQISKNFNVGATYMHLFERPYTQKVSYGDDPINNRIFGLDMDYSTKSDWLTRAIDKLPFISTKAESSISFKTELAALKPGHSSAINSKNEKGGVIILDDFEGASVKLYLNNENDWILSSTPVDTDFPESKDTTWAYGANRALLSWYVAEGGSRTGNDNKDPYTRLVKQRELFDRDIPAGTIQDLRTLDVNFYPEERGPYNFDVPGGYTVNGQKVSAGVYWDNVDNELKLKDPESRWGGMMRYIRFSDFEKLNMEYLEFWMLNPFMTTNSRPEQDITERGKLVINLGNVSEDILKDGLQFYENSLPLDGEYVPKTKTIWGEVPNDTPLDDAFPNDRAKIEQMDLGLDGLNNDKEITHFRAYVNAIQSAFPSAGNKFLKDVANDDWVYFGVDSLKSEDLLVKYKKYNNPQGNFPDNRREERRGRLRPDKEELNLNKSLDVTESYYKYEIPIIPVDTGTGDLVLDTSDVNVKKYITDVKKVKPEDGGRTELWYRVRIPINEGQAIGGIEGLRSIQFMRMYVSHFKKPKTFRLAEFSMVRNQWRKLVTAPAMQSPVLNLDVVGIEENSKKAPLGYVSPKGVTRERLLTNYSNIRQDEKSLALKFENLTDSSVVSVYKLTSFDARLFKKLQLYVHAESYQDINDRELYLFIRLGKDFTDNYYEYEIPLKMSDITAGNSIENVWPDANFLDIHLKDFTDLKIERNKKGVPTSTVYFANDIHNTRNAGVLKIKGNPSLGYIKDIQIGITTYQQGKPLTGEVWINELRVVGMDEKGGVAATANLDVKLADLGSFNAAFNYMSIGFGALDQKLAQRSMDEVVDYDLSTSLQLGRFFPKNWQVNLPVYLQYGQTIKTPKYDPYELDLTVDESLAAAPDAVKRQKIKDRSLDIVTVKSLNLANISINKGNNKYPWAPSNIKMGYFYTNKNQKNPILKNEDETDQKLTLDYGFSRGTNYIKPFKKMTWIKSKFIKNIHFNLLPNSFSFNTQLRKYDNVRLYREPELPKYEFEDKRFTWDRNYTLQWNFSKNLKLNFTAKTRAIVDQLKKWGIHDEYRDIYGVKRDDITPEEYMLESLKKFGRPKDYNHNIDLSYTLPLRDISFLKWVKINAKYRASYDWIGTPPFQLEDYGNVIKNQQNRSLNARLDFEKLYKSVKYLKKIDKGFSSKKSKRSKKKRRVSKNKKSKKKGKRKKEREPSAFEKILFRPLLALRDFKLSYKEDLGTVVPGYIKGIKFLGTTDNFSSPGLDFVAGLQPDDFGKWLEEAATKKSWIVTNDYFNSQFYQNSRKSVNAKIKLEPINNLKIDLEFKKTYVRDNSREFKNVGTPDNPDFRSLSVMDRGMFEVSYYALKTLFNKDYEVLFERFSEYRKDISARLFKLRFHTDVVTRFHPQNPEYAYGYGPQSQDVLIPAFLAAYTGVDVDKVTLDIYDEVGDNLYLPKPNWRAEFNLNRFSFLKDIFSSFKITNSYKSVLKVANIQTDLNYISIRSINPDSIDFNEKNYYSEYIIPSMVLEERFDPVIGLSIKTKNDLSIRIDYKKSRSLLLSQKSLQQTRSEELVLNFGYIIKNVYLPLLSKKPKKKRRGKGKKNKNLLGQSGRRSKSARNNLRDLRISFDMSIRDNEVKEYLFDSGRKGKPTHGNYRISISPVVEYNVTDNFSLQANFSYDKTVPYVNNSYPTTNYRGTVTAKYSLK